MRRALDADGLDHLTNALDLFRCFLDVDIETFLRKKAVMFSERGLCAVYLLLNEQEFDAGKIKIDAYFTLSHKALIPSTASKSSVKKASGFKSSEIVQFVLIGQLGKYIEKDNTDNIISSDISGKEILDYAFEIINDSSELIPCRCVLVECSDNPKVQKVYMDYQFKFFQYDSGHYQFYKLLD